MTVSFLYRKIYNKVIFLLKPFFLKLISNKVRCNICDWKDFKFVSDTWHKYSICPNCQSSIRQRLFWALIQKGSFNKIISKKKIIHFAPERCLESKISKLASEYITADFGAQGYSYKHIDMNLDISNMHVIENNSFDCLIAFDVLEHVKNDLNAIKEIYRVLRWGGYCILSVPQKDSLSNTQEDLSNLHPDERRRKFGQWDHWRIYGSDFKEKLEEEGFKIQVVDHTLFDNDMVKRNVLFPPILSDRLCATNFRKIYLGKKEISD